MLNKKNIIFLLSLIIIIFISIFIYKFNNDNIKNIDNKKILNVKKDNSDEILKKEKELFERDKKRYKEKKEKEYMEIISKSGLSKDYDFLTIQDIYNTAGEKAFSGKFNNPKLLDPNTNRILVVKKIKGVNTESYIQQEIVVEDFLIPYINQNLEEGRIKLYLIDKNLKRTQFVNTPSMYFGINSEYKSFNTKLIIRFHFLNEEELKNTFKDVQYIEIEGKNAYAYHKKYQDFSFKFPVKLLN